MRASSRIMWLAVAGWLLAVLAHAIFLMNPSLRLTGAMRSQWLQRAGASAAPCRVFLIGSSPVVFGLSAAALQSKTGCAAFNVGLTAIGDVLNPYLASVLENLREGDLVVLSDRRWTQTGAAGSTCSEMALWRCMVGSMNAIPYLADDVRIWRGKNRRRSHCGDLDEFPMLANEAHVVSATTLTLMEQRVEMAAVQVAMIRARGGRPVLAAAPLYVTEGARLALEPQFRKLDAMMEAVLGPNVWLGPALQTEARLFSLDGQHASAAGRMMWTGLVQPAVLVNLPKRF